MVRSNPSSRPDTMERPRKARTRSASKAPLADAHCEHSHGRTTVFFSTVLTAQASAVWTMLVDPSHLTEWSPFTADRDLSHVGRVTLRMLDAGDAAASDIPSVVFVADRDHRLEYSWADDTISWTLQPDESRSGTTVVLRQTLADEKMASAIAAGWHLCLQVAESLFGDHPLAPIRGSDAMEHGWTELNREYARQFGVEPTRIG